MREISKLEEEMPKIASSVLDDQGVYNVLSGKSEGDVAEKTKAETFLKTFKSKNGIRMMMIYDYKSKALYKNMLSKRYVTQPENDPTVFGRIYSEYKKGKNYISIEDIHNDESVYYLYNDYRGYYVIIGIDKISVLSKTVNAKSFIKYDNWIYYKEGLFITNCDTTDPMQTKVLSEVMGDYAISSYEYSGDLYVFKRAGNFLYVGAVDNSEYLSAGVRSAQSIWVFATLFFIFVIILYLIYNKKYNSIENKYTTAVKMHEKNMQRATIEKLLFKAFVKNVLSVKENKIIYNTFNGCNNFIVVIIDIDDATEKFDEDDVSIYKYGIINMCNEVLSVFGITESVMLYDGYIGVVIGSDSCVKSEDICECVHMLMGIVEEYIGSTITCAVSRNFNECDEMLKKCSSIIDLTYYRYMYGNGSLLLEEKILENRLDTEYPVEVQDSILQAITDNDEEKFDSSIAEFKESIKNILYEDAQKWCITLLHAIIYSKAVKRKKLTVNILSLYNSGTFDAFAEKLKYTMFEEPDDEKHDNEFKTRVELLIDEHYGDADFCMDTIAEIIGISNVYVGRKFKYEFGTTFNGYLANYRIEKSLDMLKNTDEKIFEISTACGFRSATYFSTMFKKLMRMSPNEYREQFGNDIDE